MFASSGAVGVFQGSSVQPGGRAGRVQEDCGEGSGDQLIKNWSPARLDLDLDLTEEYI